LKSKIDTQLRRSRLTRDDRSRPQLRFRLGTITSYPGS
jgi:hypothetical protein